MDNTKKFDGVSDTYSRYRPGYPGELVKLLEQKAGLNRDSVIADIGSGTGKLARIFLENGNFVFCVEPNGGMRAKAAEDLAVFQNVVLVDGTAEKTTLPDKSVDYVIAGQSFHWFDPDPAGKEFNRILRANGKVILVWNNRVTEKGGFTSEYDEICMKYSNGYHGSGSRAIDDRIISDFFTGEMLFFNMKNLQKLDLEGLEGRYFSASYALDPGSEGYADLIDSFEELFRRYQVDGYVSIEYETVVYAGSVSARD